MESNYMKIINTLLEYSTSDDKFYNPKEIISKEYYKAVEDKENLNKLQPEKGISHADHFLEDVSWKENRLITKLDDITKNDSLNPHVRPYKPSHYYCGENIKGKKLQHIEKFEELFEYIEDENGHKILKLIEIGSQKNAIIQIGEKGSGKTLTQNLILHKYHDLLEKNKLFWVRCDAAKLYSIWKKALSISDNSETDILLKNEDNFISIEEYLYGQLAYVFCKHLKGCEFESPLIVEIYEKIKSSEYNFSIFSAIKDTKKQQTEEETKFPLTYSQRKHINSFTDILDYFMQTIIIDEGTLQAKYEHRHNDKSYLLEHIFLPAQEKNKKSRAFKLWIDTGKSLRDFMLSHGYYVMNIIDGIDNINMDSARSSLLYRKMKQSLRDALSDNPKLKHEIRWISCRERTEREMHILFKNYNDILSEKVFIENKWIKQDDIGSLNLILRKRADYVILKIKELDNKKFYDNCISIKIYQHLLSHNFAFNSGLELWHNNLRCMLRNISNLVRLVSFRFYFLNKPETFNIEHQLTTFSKLNLLLNGRFYIGNQFNFSNNEGDNFFNIFAEYRRLDDSPLYLIHTRILLYLNSFNLNTTQKEIVQFLSIYFKYNSGEIEHSLEKLRIYGLIDSKVHEQNLHFQTKSPKKIKDADELIKFNIHEKGKYALEIFYSDIDFLYHTCIASPIPMSFKDKIFIHSNRLKDSKTFYPISSLRTGLFFLKYILSLDSESISRAINIARNKKKDKEFMKKLKLLDLKSSLDTEKLRTSMLRKIQACHQDVDYEKDLNNYLSEILN